MLAENSFAGVEADLATFVSVEATGVELVTVSSQTSYIQVSAQATAETRLV